MKKMIMGLMMMFVMAFSVNAHANEYVPDTEKITADMEYVIIGEGDSATPMWISHNPTCYNKQDLKTGVYESWIDVNEEIVYVYKDGVEVQKIKL